MGIFDGMNAATTGGRRYLDVGTYVIKIVKCGKLDAKESGKGVASFFVELEVMSSDSKSCPIGTLASWAQPIKPTDKGLGVQNIKQFLAAAIGLMTIFDVVDPVTGQKQSAEAIAEAVTSRANPFKDKMVGVKVTAKVTRTGTDFSKHDWFPFV